MANAGLILPATLARHLGLSQLVDRHLDLRDAPGRANTGDKVMTLVASAPGFRGGRVWRAATKLTTPRFCAPAGRLGPSAAWSSAVHPPLSRGQTLGTFLRSFRWGHVRQLDRVSRELLARAWPTGARPGPGPLTIDLDSTICETFRLGKEGARHHCYTSQRGYHPLLAVAAGTGNVLVATAAGGPRQHRSRRRPLPAGDGGAGALRRKGADRTCRPDSLQAGVRELQTPGPAQGVPDGDIAAHGDHLYPHPERAHVKIDQGRLPIGQLEIAGHPDLDRDEGPPPSTSLETTDS